MIKGFLKSRRQAKDAELDNNIALVALCDAEMEKFHFAVTDTILEKTGKTLNKYPSYVVMGFLMYETQAAIEIAKSNKLPEKLYEHVAAKNLIKAGLPQDQAYGIVHGFMQFNLGAYNNSVDGKIAYLKMQEGEEEFLNHIVVTFNRLENEERLKSDSGL